MADTLLFSQFTTQEFEAISEILSTVFVTSNAELKNLYQKMSNDFNKDDWPPQFVDRKFFQSGNEDFREICYESPVITVDLPSIFELDNGISNKPTLVIVGQDSKSEQDSEQIRIGTPYGLHHKDSRENLNRTKLYFEMICVLLKLGYRVYLTDIYKVWVCNPNRPYYGKKLPKVDRERFIIILRSELHLLEPTALITWGRESCSSISQLNLDIPHLSFPHPSGAANGTWKKLIGQSPTHANKIAYFQSEIAKFLSPINKCDRE